MLQQIIKTNFPCDEIISAYAYGSKIFPQYKTKPGKQTDLIFIVDDVEEFHKANKIKNLSHYSYIERFLNQAKLINNIGACVYYHQNIIIDGNIYKYGVISKKHFDDSMNNFSNMFICGRFHKPVLKIFSNESNNFDNLIKKNQKNAFALVALKNKVNVSKEMFYHDIINLSYMGDIRNCVFMESKDKVKNMLKGSFSLYDQMYCGYSDKSFRNKLKLNEDVNFYFKQLPNYIRNKLPSNLIGMSLEKRKEYIDRLLKIENIKISSFAALSGLYSSLNFTYVADKYVKRVEGMFKNCCKL